MNKDQNIINKIREELKTKKYTHEELLEVIRRELEEVYKEEWQRHYAKERILNSIENGSLEFDDFNPIAPSKKNDGNKNQKDNGDEKNKDPQGLSGWLILVGIGLFSSVMNIFSTFVTEGLLLLNEELITLTDPSNTFYTPNWQPALLITDLKTILIGILLIYVIYLFVNKSKKFPKYCIFTLWLHVVLYGLIYLFLSGIFDQHPSVAEAFNFDIASDFFRVLFSAIILTWYLIVSRRVENTFTN